VRPLDDPATTERLAALFDQHAARLFRLAARLAGEREEARDLVQEAFLRVARSPRRLPASPEGAEAWLVRTLVNLCRDRSRRLRVRERWREAQLAEDPPAAPPSTEARMELGAALQRLSPTRRAAILLCELEGHTPSEAARLLGLRPATLRWHLAVARRRLRSALRETTPETSETPSTPRGEEPAP
jgi:RNA polymerase sigma-70 factor (ECF subfamily)